MSRLPVRPRRPSLMQVVRTVLLVLLALLIRQHSRQQSAAAIAGSEQATVSLESVQPLFPQAASVTPPDAAGRSEIHDAEGELLGRCVHTSPQADHLVGFSGPTNTLIGFDPDGRILGLRILSSADTREHVAQVRQDARFLSTFNGRTWEAAADVTEVEAVSGATLTSLTIAAGVISRLGGNEPSLLFPDSPQVEEVVAFSPEADRISADLQRRGFYRIEDAAGTVIGVALRTSPEADDVIGYQAPTDALVLAAPDGRIVGLTIRGSLDNQPYVRWVTEDEYFLTRLNDRQLNDLPELDLREAGIEGVSGATMTSMGVANGVVEAATADRLQRTATFPEPRKPEALLRWTARDTGTVLVVCLACVIGLGRLRGNAAVRIVLQLIVIATLGFLNGDMLSQAVLVGWAQNGVPWQGMPGMLFLTAVALLLPWGTGHNVYCSHVCPHGAAQQLLKGRLFTPRSLGSRWHAMLVRLPAVLLVLVLLAAFDVVPLSLVDLEPFDAYVWRVAGWATLSLAVVGLVVSAFVPMAYCQYGCPTGALLKFVRRDNRDHQLRAGDILAIACLLLAGGILWLA